MALSSSLKVLGLAGLLATNLTTASLIGEGVAAGEQKKLVIPRKACAVPVDRACLTAPRSVFLPPLMRFACLHAERRGEILCPYMAERERERVREETEFLFLFL